MTPRNQRITRVLLGCGIAAASPLSYACSSCGCSLSSDWASQGYAAGPGFLVDLRYDFFNQNQLRTGTVDRGNIPLPADREIQQKTINRNVTLALDYSPNADWGVNVQIPYFDRYHTTVAPGDTDISTSHTQSIGDVRVLGRYQGFSRDQSSGIQFGLKFATGSFHNEFIDGPQVGSPLDRGLQPGTGTTYSRADPGARSRWAASVRRKRLPPQCCTCPRRSPPTSSAPRSSPTAA